MARKPTPPRPVYTDPAGKIPPEVMEGFVEGFDREEYTVSAIKQHLLTEDQRKWLYDMRMDIADLLNGRYGEKEEDGILKMFEDWNAKLGREVFGS